MEIENSFVQTFKFHKYQADCELKTAVPKGIRSTTVKCRICRRIRRAKSILSYSLAFHMHRGHQKTAIPTFYKE